MVPRHNRFQVSSNGTCKCVKCVDKGLSEPGLWLIAHREDASGFLRAVSSVLGPASVKKSGRNFCLQSKMLKPELEVQIKAAVNRIKTCPSNQGNLAFRPKIGKNNICAVLDEALIDEPGVAREESSGLASWNGFGQSVEVAREPSRPMLTNSDRYDEVPEGMLDYDQTHTVVQGLFSGNTVGLTEGAVHKGVPSEARYCGEWSDTLTNIEAEITREKDNTSKLTDELCLIQEEALNLSKRLQESRCRTAKLQDDLLISKLVEGSV